MKKKHTTGFLTVIACFLAGGSCFAAQSASQQFYAPVLDEYAEGVSAGWDMQEYSEHGLSYIFGYDPASMAYCIMDLNGDGIDEMLVGSTAEPAEDLLKYGYCYEIYTLSQNEPVKIAEGTERCRYAVCDDGTICYFWTGGAACSGWDYYILKEGEATLTQVFMVGTDGNYYQTDDPDEASFMNTAYPFEYPTNTMITLAQADALVDSYTYIYPDFTPISSYEAGKAPQGNNAAAGILDVDTQACEKSYQGLINLYREAADEHWSVERYIENNLAFIYGAYGLKAGYCFADINRDGIAEMLLGTPGTFTGDPEYGYFYAIYTLDSDTPVLLLERGESSELFLCDDGMIGVSGYSADMSQTWEFYSLPAGGNQMLFYRRMGWYLQSSSDQKAWYIGAKYLADDSENSAASEEEVMDEIHACHMVIPTFTEIPGTDQEHTDEHTPFYGIWCLATQDENEALDYARLLENNDYPARVCLSSDWSNLNPQPWYVVTAVECQSEEEASSCLAWVRQVNPDAYVKWTGNYIG